VKDILRKIILKKSPRHRNLIIIAILVMIVLLIIFDRMGCLVLLMSMLFLIMKNFIKQSSACFGVQCSISPPPGLGVVLTVGVRSKLRGTKNFGERGLRVVSIL
jgi:hypothetical protein